MSSWWTLPNVQADRSSFYATLSELTGAMHARTTSDARFNTLTYREELNNTRELKKRVNEPVMPIVKAARTLPKNNSAQHEESDCKQVAPMPVLGVRNETRLPQFAAAKLAGGQNTMLTLTRKNILKNGRATYGIAGLVGLVVLPAKFIPEGSTPPETILLDAGDFVFAQPNAEQSEKAKARAAKRAELDAKIAERAAKAQERAKKAQERADKLAAQAAKRAGAAPAQPEGEQAAE